MSEASSGLEWIGSSKKDYDEFPAKVKDDLGYALYGAQLGGKPASAKPLKGFGGASILELMENHDGDTYRAVYTVRFAGMIYVLHAFKKKSKSGIATPKQDLDLVANRLKTVEGEYRKWNLRREQ